MKITIRNERISDYNSIANINYGAFLGWHPDNQYVSEPVLVDFLRHNSRYDPEMSLIAEVDGQPVGHVLFSPYEFMVLGREQKGVVLAPIAVKPEFQRLGIGKMLIEEGHRRARQKGYSFSLLCGHTEYYPRFGYKTKMFSLSGSKAVLNKESFDPEGYSARPVNAKDLSWIIYMWNNLHRDDSLALFPGYSISEWNNISPGCRSTMILKHGQVVAYVRYSYFKGLNIKELLTDLGDIQEVLSYLAFTHYGKPQGEMHVALEADKLHKLLHSREMQIADAWYCHEAFMIKVLDDESDIGRYCDLLEKREINPGIIIFPNVFDMDDGRVD